MLTSVHPDLLVAQKLVYEPSGLLLKNLTQEAESSEYSACSFELNNKRIKFRTGKITPTKTGQFVTLWKRIGDGEIQPYDVTDPIDFFVISVRDGEHFGQFVFPKAILLEKGVLSKEGKGGKRAIRIYPQWDKAMNSQAKITQSWQLIYFYEIHLDKTMNINNFQNLFDS